MHEKRPLLVDLAAYRELTPEQRRELVERAPGAPQLLAAYERQDELLAALPQPQVPAAMIGRIWAATAGAPAKAERSALAGRRAVPALVVVMLVALLSVTSYAAAQSLPGDGLYGLKRAAEQVRLAVTTRESSRLAYERLLEERRRLEIRALLAQGRQGAEIAFMGPLRQEPDGSWTVAGLPVALPPDAQPVAGAQVRVEGWTADGRVRARVMAQQGAPQPIPASGPTNTPDASPTSTSTGVAEPQFGQRATMTAAPTSDPLATGDARVRSRTSQPAISPTPAPASTAPRRLGQTATVTGKNTSAPTTAATKTPAPQQGSSATAESPRPTTEPDQTKPEATREQQAGPTSSPKASQTKQGEPPATPAGSGGGPGDGGGKP